MPASHGACAILVPAPLAPAPPPPFGPHFCLTSLVALVQSMKIRVTLASTQAGSSDDGSTISGHNSGLGHT